MMKRLVFLIVLFVVGQSFVSTAKGAADITSTAEELSIAQTVNSGAEAATPNAGAVKKANVVTPNEKAENLSSLPTKVVEANVGVGSPPSSMPTSTGSVQAGQASSPQEVNTTGTEANTIREPNTEDMQAKMLEDLEKVFEHVRQDGQKEKGEWLRFEAKERVSLARTVENQVMDELKVLREIAADEKAAKTTAAIDMLIADRKERYEKVISRMESDEEKARRREQLREERSRDREPRRNERLQERRSREIPPKRETTGPNVGTY